jgi:hypothetical protein
MGLGQRPCFGYIIRLVTPNEGKKKMNAETSKSGNTIRAFDFGKGSIGANH